MWTSWVKITNQVVTGCSGCFLKIFACCTNAIKKCSLRLLEHSKRWLKRCTRGKFGKTKNHIQRSISKSWWQANYGNKYNCQRNKVSLCREKHSFPQNYHGRTNGKQKDITLHEQISKWQDNQLTRESCTKLAPKKSYKEARAIVLSLSDKVRLAQQYLPFKKWYKQKFTEKIFTIIKTSTFSLPTFNLRDESGDISNGNTYEPELVKDKFDIYQESTGSMIITAATQWRRFVTSWLTQFTRRRLAGSACRDHFPNQHQKHSFHWLFQLHIQIIIWHNSCPKRRGRSSYQVRRLVRQCYIWSWKVSEK